MRSFTLLFAGVCLLPLPGRAQGLYDPVLPRHHFGASLPTWFNAGARFSAARATNPGAAPSAPATLADGRVDRFYDDGFNRVNSVGNPVLLPGGAPLTTFFLYQDAAQAANVAGAGTLSLHSVQLNGGDYTRTRENRPIPGLELFYRYDWKEGKTWSVSWEATAGYQYFNWRENGAPNSTVDLITDVFALGGVPLASPGVAGPFVPVPFATQIGSTPTRTQGTVAAAVAGQRKLDLHALQLRLAPVVNWEPSSRWRVGVQAGLALGIGFSGLSFAEQITVADPATPVISQSGCGTDAHFWAGLFSAVRLSHQLSDNWSTHAEVRHVLMDPLRHTGATRSAEIRLSDGIGITAGISYRFR